VHRPVSGSWPDLWLGGFERVSKAPVPQLPPHSTDHSWPAWCLAAAGTGLRLTCMLGQCSGGGPAKVSPTQAAASLSSSHGPRGPNCPQKLA
jgi:hypothetical protein